MRFSDHYDVDAFAIPQGHRIMKLGAGNRGTELIVPPAGPDYAFTRGLWAREVEVSVSPTGRSVRVWVDGIEVPR